MSEASESPEPVEFADDLTPVGEGTVLARAGDCMASIAVRCGFFWETLWHLPDNAALEEARKDPNVLLPGDRVTVPALRTKQVNCKTGVRHRFRRKGIPERVAMVLTSEEDEGPRADLAYTLEVEGVMREGRTDGDGLLVEWVPPGTRTAMLRITEEDGGEDGEEEVYQLSLGGLEPIDSHGGLSQRLRALGLDTDGDDLGPLLEAFQSMHGLEVTGEPDEETLAMLSQEYGR